MSGFVSWLGANALAASLLAAVVWVVARRIPWPAVRHVMWGAVLVRLLLPPGVPLSVPVPQLPIFAPAAEVARESARELPAVVVPIAGTEPRFLPIQRPAPERAAASADREPVAHLTSPSRASAGTALGWLSLIGTLAVLGLTAGRVRRLQRSLRDASPADTPLRERTRELAERIGLRRAPRVLTTDAALSPMLLPGWRPRVVFPRRLLAQLEPAERDALLAHELAHVRRGDAWIRLLELAATALFWWLPVLWGARRRLRLAEETACDELVTRVLPQGRKAYARGLLKTVDFVTAPARVPALATGAADPRDLKERVMSILEKPRFSPAPRRAWGFAIALSLAAVSLAPAWTRDDLARRAAPPEPPRALVLDSSEPVVVAPPTGLTGSPEPPIAIAVDPVRPFAVAPAPPVRAFPIRRVTGMPHAIESSPYADEFQLRRQVFELQQELETLQSQLRSAEIQRELTRAEKHVFEMGEVSPEDAERAEKELAQLYRRAELNRDHLAREAEFRREEAEAHLRAQELDLLRTIAEAEEDDEELEQLDGALLELERELASLQLRRHEMELEQRRAELDLQRSMLEDDLQRLAKERSESEAD